MTLDATISPGGLLDRDIVLVDVGARNGMLDLRSLAPFVAAYGFEPSAQEFEKLQQGVTDLDRSAPGYRPRYRSEKYYPYALTGTAGDATLYITRGSGASSTLRPNASFLQRFQRKNWRSTFDVLRTEVVPGRTLGQFLGEARLDGIDLLKLDTQGNEYDILDDAAVLARVGIVKTEVEFVELYEGQKLYGDVARLMRENGFLQFDLRFEAIHTRGQCAETLRGGILSWADAYFLNERAGDRDAARRRVLVLFDLGNDDLAYHLARSASAFSEDELQGLHRWFLAHRAASRTPRQRLKQLIERATGLRISRAPARDGS